MAISELCGNAVEHGENPLGCYVAAQRYKTHTVLAVGDLGCGIPTRIRDHFRGVEGDPAALELALREGVTTTGRSSRGQGFYWVMEEAAQSHVRRAKLDIRAGRGHLARVLDWRGQMKTTAKAAPNKIGTWVTVELGPKSL
jgi:anti-sigma regulatory factor (Ser/Thr protein kinase)